MGIQFVSIKCPECGATLDVDENRPQIFCSYCGSKIMIHNDNEQVYRHIDEAGIKQAETDQIVRLKQMEMFEKGRAAKEKVKALKIKITILLGFTALVSLGIGYGLDAEAFIMVGMVSMIIIAYMWLMNNDKEDEYDFDGKKKLPSIGDYNKQSYVSVEEKFRSAGFTNIKCVALNDLRMGVFRKPNVVESITINGQNVSWNKKYSPDSLIIISYHSIG